MSGNLSDIIRLLIAVAIVLFVLGTVFRLSDYDNNNPVPVIGITPSAFQRAADTVLFFAIAAGVWGLLAMKEGQSTGGRTGDQ